MDIKKKHRKVLRAAFSKKANDLQRLFDDDPSNIPEIKVAWDIFQENYDALKVTDGVVYDLLLEEDASEEDLLMDMECTELYTKRYLSLFYHYEELRQSDAKSEEVAQQSEQSQGNSSAVGLPGKRKFKLPTIQLKVFDGNIKEWLPFWSQFKKVHEDTDIDPEDKIDYLFQATVPGSRARQLVESFPAIGKNYAPIVDCLTSRFGREDLQIEVYIRELLKLILNNAISPNKLDVATLYDRLETQLRALETLGVKSEKCAAVLFPLIESCFPEGLLRVWQRSPRISEFKSSQNSLGGSEHPTMEEKLNGLMTFLKNEVENDQRIQLASEGFGLKPLAGQKESGRGGTVTRRKFEHFEQGVSTAAGLVNVNPKLLKCIFCDNSHEAADCFKAQKLSLDKKKSILSNNKACFCCLKIGHQARLCRARLKCVICGRSHFPLMCPSLPANSQQKVSGPSKLGDNSVPNEVSKELVSVDGACSHVFMQTLKIRLEGINGSRILRALIDTGSQKSYILQSTASILGLVSKRREKIIHCLFGGSLSEQHHECFDIKMNNGNFSLSVEVLAQPVICTDIPPVFYGDWVKELSSLGVELSDLSIGSAESGKIDILVGSDVAGVLYTGRRHVLSCGLVAVETFLGWTLMGKIPLSKPRSTTMVDIALFSKDASLPQLWELDILGIKDPVEKKSQEDLALATKAVFLETLVINDEERYEVRLPWLEGHPPLPSSYSVAKTRLQNTVGKLKRDGLMKEYGQVFQEWLTENIIEEVPEETPALVSVHYLPHRPVIKEGSTTKIRPVFDASAREKDKPSLNQCLNKGPNIIELIPNILTRFRLNKLGVVSDIRKAFLQVSVNETDRNFLRFLWLDPEGRERIFRHRRVVFGVSSSPFLLGATIEYHLAESLKKCVDESTPYSKQTILQLLKSFYVDNCVTSLSDDDRLQVFIEESTVLMSEAKFDLRGWEFSGQVCDTSDTLPGTAVLGLMWDKCDDTLRVNEACLKGVNELADKPISKRVMLSFAHRIFDPIGFTAPSTLLPKLLLQKTWEKKLTWDATVDSEMEDEFRRWLNELYFLPEIRIPRWIHRDNFDHGSLHVFCDASKDSYAAVIFFRGVFEGNVFIRLLAAKSRIAPLKKSSIPRLELLAALIGTRLFVSLKEELNFDQEVQFYFWSDSSTVLSWIRRKENWGTFVGNRVKEIVTHTSSEDWHFVPGILNPADLPSRGCSPKQLCKSRWWEGPSWLYDEPKLWPQAKIVCDESEIQKEKKKSVAALLNSDSSLEDWHLSYFSRFTKTLRMIGWIFRFSQNIRNPSSRLQGELSVTELEGAEVHILKLIQQECFKGENDPRLCNLSPFKDERGLIRLRTRISNRKDAEQFRFPVVLPAKHFLVDRLIFEQHVKSLHVGTQSLMGILREKYWILGGRRAVKSPISGCVVCKRQKGKAFVASLPPLPLNRVRDAATFEITGVDFAGPLFIKNGEKAWVCLFTCAVYRAVHLELCTGLSTPSFMQALRRFIARRGRPKTIYSDNGTNFVGTENMFNRLDWEKIITDCSVDRISWRFNPPTASWWGGFWERLVGVLKQILRKVLGRACVSYEDLVTILCDCEAIINARPLTYVSNDIDELAPLTPMMFLREQVCTDVPDCDIVDTTSLSKRIQHLQKLRNDLRQRFRTEYLGQLKSWSSKKPGRKISLGELVLVGNDNDKRLQWPLGRVVEVIPGSDGQIRLVRINTAKGSLLRPIQRLYPLECDSELSAVQCNELESSPITEKTEVTVDSDLELAENADGGLGVIDFSNSRVTRRGREIKVPKRYL